MVIGTPTRAAVVVPTAIRDLRPVARSAARLYGSPGGSGSSDCAPTGSARSRTASTARRGRDPRQLRPGGRAPTAATAPSARTIGVIFPFLDTDVYKWLEAVGWELGRAPDPALAALADEAIELVAAAQRPDGYLNSFVQVVAPGREYEDLAWGHELYCVGHLIQAAIAWQRALGDDRLLEVAHRGPPTAVDRELGPDGPRGRSTAIPRSRWPSSSSTGSTGERRYLEPRGAR